MVDFGLNNKIPRALWLSDSIFYVVADLDTLCFSYNPCLERFIKQETSGEFGQFMLPLLKDISQGLDVHDNWTINKEVVIESHRSTVYQLKWEFTKAQARSSEVIGIGVVSEKADTAQILESKHRQSLGQRSLAEETSGSKHIYECKDEDMFLESILRFQDSIIDPYVLIDSNGLIVGWNSLATQLLRHVQLPDLNRGSLLKDYFCLGDAEIFDRIFHIAQTGRTCCVNISLGAVHSVLLLVLTKSIKDRNGRTEYIAFYLRDIEHEKRTETTLKEKDYMLQAIYDSTTEACSFIDKNLKIRYNNKVAREVTEKLFGKPAAVGDNVVNFILPDYQDIMLDIYHDALKGHSATIERSDGTNWWQLSFYPVKGCNGQIIGLAQNVQNITERKRKEQQLEIQKEMFRKIAWQQSHIVRRPVASILGICSILTELEMDKQEVKKWVSLLKRSADELDYVVRKIVAEANKMYEVTSYE